MSDGSGGPDGRGAPRRQADRKQADRTAAEALQRMFDPPVADGTQAGADQAGTQQAGAPVRRNGRRRATARRPVAQQEAIHDAVMAGLDAFTGGSPGGPDQRDAGPGAQTADPADPQAAASRGGSLALALAASDEEELRVGTGGRGGVPSVPATPGRADGWADRYDSGDLDEDLVLAGLSGPRQRFNPLAALGRSMGSGLTQAGEMTWLAGTVIKSGLTRPKGYWTETKEQIYSALKLCWVPMVISITAFGIGAPGLQGGNVFTIFGVPEREGSFIVATGIREFAPWIDAMIVAGVVGTAITADIGARRIREEIDAMEVLGVDPIRELVLPRILSTAIITGLFDIVALLVGIVGGYIASVLLLGASTAGYTSQFFSQANVPDLVGSFAKTFLFGAVVGVVCSYKGMRASGGPSGVGKAVNSAVVISFALIWTINYVFTNTLLGFAPSTQTFH